VTPTKATKAQQKAFFDWHVAKDEAARRDKQAKVDADMAAAKARALEAATSLWAKQVQTFKENITHARAAGVLRVDEDLRGLLS
jgi:serine protease inhibitor